MPKRPLSAYNFFFGQMRRIGASEGKQEGTKGNTIGFAGLARAVAASWKSLGEDSRRPFYDMAAQEQIRYKKAYDEWRISRRRCPSAPTKIEYALQPRSPTPLDPPKRMTAHASRMKVPQHTKCYSPETKYGCQVPGTVSVTTEVSNDVNDSFDLSPHHYGSYTVTPAHSPNGYDNFYDNNTTTTNNTYNTQSQRNSHPGHYRNFRNESTLPIHSTEQHESYYSCRVHSPGAYDVALSGDNGPVYSSNYYGNAYSNHNYGPAQHMWSSAQPTVNSVDFIPDYDAVPWKRPCSSSVPSPATVDNKSLVDIKGEPDCDAAPWKRPSSPIVLSIATVNSTSLADRVGAPNSIDTEESSGHYELEKAESFENMMDVLEKEDDNCDVWAWLKDI
jgi:hypothetical protein